MNVKIVEVNPPAPATPRTWTREELESGTAPEGLYSFGGDVHYLWVVGNGCRSVLLASPDRLCKAVTALHDGPFTHVGTVDVTLHLDRSKAVR